MNIGRHQHRRYRSHVLLAALVCCVGALSHAATALGQADSQSKTLARSGAGWLEEIDGAKVLHLSGTPYEMGHQHGVLLREQVKKNMHNILHGRGEETLVELGPIKVKPRTVINSIVQIQKKYVPEKYFEEMRGLADGSGLPLEDVLAGNFIPELFHCSGFAIANSATKNGELYHGRVLDYATDWGLQEHAVVMVCEPKEGIACVNVTYAGFIGCVTGMNAAHVSIGEMGGGGLGHWEGVPMAILVREALHLGKDLDAAIAVFRDNPRTCQYFYVLADGKTKRAVGMEASWNKFTLIKPGEAHPMLAKPVKDCVLLSAGSRYEELSRRAKSGHGQFTAEDALQLMSRPVAMRSNLHNVLFEPKSTRFWVSHASEDGRPAAENKYQMFQLSELLKRQPTPDAPKIGALPAKRELVSP